MSTHQELLYYAYEPAIDFAPACSKLFCLVVITQFYIHRRWNSHWGLKNEIFLGFLVFDIWSTWLLCICREAVCGWYQQQSRQSARPPGTRWTQVSDTGIERRPASNSCSTCWPSETSPTAVIRHPSHSHWPSRCSQWRLATSNLPCFWVPFQQSELFLSRLSTLMTDRVLFWKFSHCFLAEQWWKLRT